MTETPPHHSTFALTAYFTALGALLGATSITACEIALLSISKKKLTLPKQIDKSTLFQTIGFCATIGGFEGHRRAVAQEQEKDSLRQYTSR
jgi:predicted lysophospholipase L1 biosynthesis ABC-type transport system permease subunit